MTETKKTQTTFDKKVIPSCHTGLTAVYYNDQNGRILWIGGWKYGASYNGNTFVIDLTGDEHKYSNTPQAFGTDAEKLMQCVSNSHAGWLSLPFPDFQIPKNMTSYQQWYDMAMGIKDILAGDKDVLVACLGGHGRSGLFCAIVGYILNNGAGWDNPVEKIRGIHCSEAIETSPQEQFVYDILGLDLEADENYYKLGAWDNYDYWSSNTNTGVLSQLKPCPKCKTQSVYIGTHGQCADCQKAVEKTIPVMDITTEMLKTVNCTCENPNCLGSWLAKECLHPVHDKLINDGYCETCMQEQLDAEHAPETQNKSNHKCELCGKNAQHAFWTGLCWECDWAFKDLAQPIHDTLTDTIPFIPHKCGENEFECKGIGTADVCNHRIHNRYVVDGLCPECYNQREQKKIAEKASAK